MANRSLYPEAVEAHSRHLVNESTQRIAQSKQELLDSSDTGVTTGLVVTVNGTNTGLIDVASGAGYAPNGEFMSLATSQIGVALASSTLGVINYILLVYDEALSSSETSSIGNGTLPTKATVSPRLVVLTAAQYAALPASDAILSNNAVDRALVVAKVTATGGALTSNAITSPTLFSNVLSASQPLTGTVTGVTVLKVDANTPAGIGTLQYTASTQMLQWKEPGSVTFGATMFVSNSGLYTVTSNESHTLVVEVAYSLLATSTVTSVITISNIYSQTIPRFTAVDGSHRTLVGGGIPTSNNPHGMTLDDLSPGTTGTLEEHQFTLHVNGITAYSDPTTLQCAVNTAPAPDSVTLVATLDAAAGAIIHGKKLTAVVGATTITFLDGTAEAATYGIFLSQDGTLYKSLIAKFPTISTFNSCIQVLDHNLGTGSHTIALDTGAGTLTLDSGIAMPRASAGTGISTIRLYANASMSTWMDVLVSDAALPVSNHSEAIATYGIDTSVSLPLANIVWSGSATGFCGAGFGGANSPNYVVDKRVFGNLDSTVVTTTSGIVDTATTIQELLGDGIYVKTRASYGTTNGQLIFNKAFSTEHAFTIAYPNTTYTGGVVYLGGNRFFVPPATIPLTNNATNYIYIVQLDSTHATVQYTTSDWNAIAANLFSASYTPLYQVSVSGGAISTSTDLRQYIGQRRTVENGVVALNDKMQAAWTATGGTTGSDGLVVTAGAGSVYTGGSAITGLGGDGITGGGAGLRGLGGQASAGAAIGGYGGYFQGGTSLAGTGGAALIAFGGAGFTAGGAGLLAAGSVGAEGAIVQGGSGKPAITATGGTGAAAIAAIGNGSSGAAITGVGGTGFTGMVIRGTAAADGGIGVAGQGGSHNATGVLAVGGTAGGVGLRAYRGDVLNDKPAIQCDGAIDLDAALQPSGGVKNQVTPGNILKAWVLFQCNNTTTPAIIKSFNVQSVGQSTASTSNSTNGTDGEFTVTLPGAGVMSSANYAISLTSENYMTFPNINGKTGSKFDCRMRDVTGTLGGYLTAAGINGALLLVQVYGLQ